MGQGMPPGRPSKPRADAVAAAEPDPEAAGAVGFMGVKRQEKVPKPVGEVLARPVGEGLKKPGADVIGDSAVASSSTEGRIQSLTEMGRVMVPGKPPKPGVAAVATTDPDPEAVGVIGLLSVKHEEKNPSSSKPVVDRKKPGEEVLKEAPNTSVVASSNIEWKSIKKLPPMNWD